MVVADGAARREPHPDRGGRLRAIPRGEHEVFLGDDAPFVRRHVAAVEAAGDLRVENGVDVATRQFLRDEISGELQDREPVERHVLIEGADYPLPVGPHLAEVVEVDAVGVAVAGIVEPVVAAVLAPLRLHEQAVDEPFVGVGAGVSHERLHVGRLGGQARDVKRESAGELPPVGLGGGITSSGSSEKIRSRARPGKPARRRPGGGRIAWQVTSPWALLESETSRSAGFGYFRHRSW